MLNAVLFSMKSALMCAVMCNVAELCCVLFSAGGCTLLCTLMCTVLLAVHYSVFPVLSCELWWCCVLFAMLFALQCAVCFEVCCIVVFTRCCLFL